MDEYYRRAIAEALGTARVIDPHCHLRPDRPAADNLADIVLYHHVWIELVSAGMPQHEVTKPGLPHELVDPEMDPLERVRRALPYLPHVQSTTSGLFLRWILSDLYHIEEIHEGNLAEADALVRARAGERDRAGQVLRDACGISHSLTVERGSGGPAAPGMLQGRELSIINLIEGKRSPQQVLADWEKTAGHSIDSAQDYRRFLAQAVADLAAAGCRFVGLWPLPYLPPEPAGEAEVTRTLQQARRGEPLSRAEAGAACRFALEAILQALRQTPVRTVQLIAGAEVLPPHRAITQWSESYCGAVARLAAQYPNLHFNLSSASDLFTQDLGILAKHIPNISVAGYWWHTFYPFYLRKSIETRLDMVPLNKIVGFFSDAYHAEWCYPKLKMVKHIFGEVLCDRVERGWYTVDMAREIITQVFYDNPAAIYGV